MKLHTGLLDGIVLQRNARNLSDAAFSGEAAGGGDLLARVTRGGKAVKGFTWVKVGSVTQGQLAGRLRGLPAGGPYAVQLKTAEGDDQATVKDVFVGDVWLCAGQSNMQGVGVDSRPIKPDPRLRTFYMDDHWDAARDPIHQLEIAVDPVHNAGSRLPKPRVNKRGVGPAVAFGAEMLRRTGVPQGLIACAHGGTSMSQWDPTLKDQGGKSLYGAMCRRLAKNGGRVAGMIWYQGESDAPPNAFPQYGPRMEAFIAAVRRDANDAKLPIAIVQLSRVVSALSCAQGWNHVQEQQRLLAKKLPAVATVPAVDLPLDDAIHVSGAGQRVLGVRLAQAMAVLRKLPRAGKPPIALRRIRVTSERGFVGSAIQLQFDHVDGELTSGIARPTGFALTRGDSVALPLIYDTRIEGSRVTLRTMLPMFDSTDVQLHYGLGVDPICNIVDTAGRSLPVFGPVPVIGPVPSTPYIRQVLISEELPSAGKLHDLAYPGPMESLKLQPRQFSTAFCDIHLTHPQDGLDHVVYFAAKLHCPTAMAVTLLLGYDGPVKMWVDGREAAHDPNGTNPAKVDLRKARLEATAGEHEVIVALGTNGGRAWGIFLRAERSDVTAAAYAKNPGAYPLPRWTIGT